MLSLVKKTRYSSMYYVNITSKQYTTSIPLLQDPRLQDFDSSLSNLTIKTHMNKLFIYVWMLEDTLKLRNIIKTQLCEFLAKKEFQDANMTYFCHIIELKDKLPPSQKGKSTFSVKEQEVLTNLLMLLRDVAENLAGKGTIINFAHDEELKNSKLLTKVIGPVKNSVTSGINKARDILDFGHREKDTQETLIGNDFYISQFISFAKSALKLFNANIIVNLDTFKSITFGRHLTPDFFKDGVYINCSREQLLSNLSTLLEKQPKKKKK